MKKNKVDSIQFDLIDKPTRDQVVDVLDALGIKERDFIDNPIKAIREYSERLDDMPGDKMLELINLVTVWQDRPFTERHLNGKAIRLISMELTGRFLGYAVDTFRREGSFTDEARDAIYQYVNELQGETHGES
jgi:hypothetical protein